MIRILLYIVFIFFGLTGCNNNSSVIVPSSSQQSNVNITESVNNDFLNIISAQKNNEKKTIAIVFASQKIGKYAIDATNAAMAYMLYKKNSFDIKIYDTIDENPSVIQDVFEKLYDDNIKNAIVFFTVDSIDTLSKVSNIAKFNIYLPLVHKNDCNMTLPNIVFGSIDYKSQFEKLLQNNENQIVDLYDNSPLGARLSNYLSDGRTIGYKKEVNNENSYYDTFLNKNNTKLKDATVFVNTPIVKSSIILSQMYANDVNVSKILSTQLNFTPLLLSLTQEEDRQNMIIANSIQTTNPFLDEYVKLLDSDINYSWVNYSTLIGIEYLLDRLGDDFPSIQLKDRQIIYPIELYQPTKNSFIKYK